MAKTGSVTIAQGKQEIANNRTYITITGKITTTGESWRGNQNTGTISVTQNGTTIYSGTFTHGAPANSTTTLFTIGLWINHDSKGDSGTIAVSYNYDSGWCTAGTSKKLTQIPRQATITTAPDFNDEENPTITYTNPAGDAVTSLQACIANTTGLIVYAHYREISITGSSYTFELSDDERKALIDAVTTGYTQKIKFYLKTIISDTTLHSTSEHVFSIINAEPTLSPSVLDVNEDTIALTGNSEILIKGFSNAQVESGGEARKHATINSQKVICGSKSLNSGSGIVEGTPSNAFLFSVTDSRNNTTTITEYAKGFIEYVNLTCNLNANPPDAEGDMVFSVNGFCFAGSFGMKDNSIRVFYRYKKGEEDYTEWIEAENVVVNTDDNSYIADVSLKGLDYQARYTFQAMVSDELMEIASVERVVKTVPVYDWSEFDFNFNVPVTIKNKSLLDIFYPIGTIYQSTQEKNPEEFLGGKWEQLKDRFLLGAGDIYKAGESGGESTHKLTVDELPAHSHTSKGWAAVVDGSGDYRVLGARGISTEHSTNTAGAGKAHNNMPPYITVYMWKRIG